MRPTTVFFDFGGTLAAVPPDLVNPWKVWTRAGRELRLRLSEDEVRRTVEDVERELGGEIYLYVGRTSEFWHRFDGAVMDGLGVRDRRRELEEAVQKVFDDPGIVRPYPETRSVLAEMQRRGYRLGVISNHHDALLSVLKFHGLDPFFETVTYSQEVGAEKPAPEVFTRALERAGCPASAALHIGDSLEADVAGARRAGLAAIWLNRGGGAGPTDVPTVRTLSKLPALLDRWDAAPSD
jgi:putative hydrolase of the HAD superfamily